MMQALLYITCTSWLPSCPREHSRSFKSSLASSLSYPMHTSVPCEKVSCSFCQVSWLLEKPYFYLIWLFCGKSYLFSPGSPVVGYGIGYRPNAVGKTIPPPGQTGTNIWWLSFTMTQHWPCKYPPQCLMWEWQYSRGWPLLCHRTPQAAALWCQFSVFLLPWLALCFLFHFSSVLTEDSART